jgi:hypothetical protein
MFAANFFKEKTILENNPFISKNWEFSSNGYFLHIVHNDFYFICEFLHYHYQKKDQNEHFGFFIGNSKKLPKFWNHKTKKKITFSCK